MRPDGYQSDVEDDEFDFGDSSSAPPRHLADATPTNGEPLAWPAKQLKAGRRGGFGKPPGRRNHIHSGGGGGYRRAGEGKGEYHSSSSSGGSMDPPQQRWRNRGRRGGGRSGQWESTMDSTPDKLDRVMEKGALLATSEEQTYGAPLKGSSGAK